MAQEAGLDMESLKTCLRDPKAMEIINNDKSEGISRGIQSTPTLFINDKMVVGFENTKAELQKLFPDGLKDDVEN
jgi:protein-disulfide isomerase